MAIAVSSARFQAGLRSFPEMRLELSSRRIWSAVANGQSRERWVAVRQSSCHRGTRWASAITRSGDEVTASGQVYVGVPQLAFRNVGSLHKRQGSETESGLWLIERDPSPGFSSLGPRQPQECPLPQPMAITAFPRRRQRRQAASACRCPIGYLSSRRAGRWKPEPS